MRDEVLTFNISGSRVSFEGQNWENPVELLALTDQWLVAKVQGGQHWVGIGSYAYGSPYLIVIKRVPDTSDKGNEVYEEHYTKSERSRVYAEAEKLTGLNLLHRPRKPRQPKPKRTCIRCAKELLPNEGKYERPKGLCRSCLTEWHQIEERHYAETRAFWKHEKPLEGQHGEALHNT